MKKQITLFTVLVMSFATFGQEKESSILKNHKFITGINLGYLSDLDQLSPSFTVTNGVLFNNRISASIGIGFEGDRFGAKLPIFLEGRYNLINKKSYTPFVSLMGGYLQPLNGKGNNYYYETYNPKGGYTSGVQIGFQNFFGNHFGLSTSFGYRFSYQTGDHPYYQFDKLSIWYPAPISRESHLLELKIAVLLK